jgi:hypothetical protein
LALVFGCSSGKDLPTQISGTWHRAQSDGTIEINLVQEPLSMILAGKSYPATIKTIDNGAYSIHLNVETETGQPEEWVLRQIWDDNGTNFSLSFNHNGTYEKLVHGQQS